MNQTAPGPVSKIRQRLLQAGLIVVIIAALIGIYFLFPSLRPAVAPRSEAEIPRTSKIPGISTGPAGPTPIPLPPGPQTYSISSQGDGIKITEAVFNPLDALVGENQTITIKAADTIGIASISATFMGDNGTKIAVPLKLTTGTAKDGTWMASWLVTLPHTRIYSAALTADNGKKPVIVDLWFR